MSSTSSNMNLTFSRYQHVETIMEADRAIRAKLGPKTEIVFRPPPSNEKVLFAKPVVYITEALHTNRSGTHPANKMDVLRLALKLLQEGDGEFKLPDVPPRSPGAQGAGRAQRRRRRRKPKAVAASKPAPKPAFKASFGVARPPPLRTENRPRKNEPAAPLPAPQAQAETDKSEEKSRDEPAPAVPAPVSAPATTPAPVSAPGQVPTLAPVPPTASASALPNSAAVQAVADPSYPLAYGVSIVTMLMAVDQIVEAHDKTPNKRDKQQRIADLIRDFQALTVIPKSSR
jgi:hypothetical protein